MWGKISLVFLSAIPIFVGFLLEPILPLGHWGWGVIAISCTLPALITYRKEVCLFLKGLFKKPLKESKTETHIHHHTHYHSNRKRNKGPTDKVRERIEEAARQIRDDE